LSGLKDLIQEVHRRSLWQVLGIYLGASWVVLQAVEILTESVGLPDWVQPFAIVLLLIGFPIVLATAFVQEGVGARVARADGDVAEPSRASEADGEVHSAADAVESPEPGASAVGAPIAPEEKATHHHLFTWRNALLGGAAAFTLLGIVTAAWIIMRTAGIGPAATLVAQGVLDERDRVILAEFSSQTGDSLLARAATEALRVDLTQSQVVTVVEPRYVAEVLARMERDPNDRLTREVASEVAIRESIKAVVAGEINSAGSGYVLTAEVVAAEGGEVLVSQRASAADSTKIIGAIDDLSKRLRERIGDPLRAIQTDDPLEQATTASLDALRMYSQAVRAIEVESRPDKGITLLEEAVALDSSFAMAWRKLGIALGNRGEEPSRAADALSRAFEHRDRLSRVERFITIGSYYDNVTNETQKSIAAYENALEAHPEHPWVLNNLALQYGELRDMETEEHYLERAVRADSTSPVSYLNLIIVQAALGKTAQAQATLDVFERRYPESPRTAELRAMLASSGGDYDRAIEHLEGVRQREARSLFWRGYTSSLLGHVAATRGRLAEAERRYRDEILASQERGLEDRTLNVALNTALLRALVARDTGGALRMADSALRELPFSELDPLDRPYLSLVSVYARAGRPDRAGEVLEEFEVLELAGSYENGERDLHWMRANIALAEGRLDEATTEFRRTNSRAGACRLCAVAGLAESFAGAGRADSAIAVYERYADTPAAYRIFGDRFFLGPTYESLGRLYDDRGDWEKAAEYYARFVELWQEADPELQPRVQAAQKRLDEIFAQRG
jgi:tetratricopeptide (TPR) repeat protein